MITECVPYHNIYLPLQCLLTFRGEETRIQYASALDQSGFDEYDASLL